MNIFVRNIICCRISNNNLRVFSSITNLRSDVENCNEKKVLSFKDIPTARRLPFFGTTLDLIFAGSAPYLHKYIDKRHRKLGPIFREKLGPIEAVFMSSPSLMRSVFLHEGQYPAHPLPESWILYNKKHNCQRGLLFMEGEEWQKNRKIMNRLILNGNVSWIDEYVTFASSKLISKWKAMSSSANGSYVIVDNLEEQLYSWSIDVIIGIMLGEDLDKLSYKMKNTIDAFSYNVHKIFRYSSKLMVFPPKLAEKLNLKMWTKFEESVTEALSLGNQIIDLAFDGKIYKRGLLKSLIDSEMPLDVIKKIFVDMIIAAGDTTAFATQWALYELARHKDAQEMGRHTFLVHRNLTKDYPFIKAIMRETLRLYPVAPFIGRFLATDAVFDNYKINQGTLVLLSLFTAGRDGDNFPNPNRFDPTRWHRKPNGQLNSVLHPQATLPFAIGSRSCIGRKIAISQMQSLITEALLNFELRCFNEKPVDVILRMVAVPDKEIKLGIKKFL